MKTKVLAFCPYQLMGVWVQRQQVSLEPRMRRTLLFHCCSATWPFTKALSRGRGCEPDVTSRSYAGTDAHAPGSIAALSDAAWVCIFVKKTGGKSPNFEILPTSLPFLGLKDTKGYKSQRSQNATHGQLVLKIVRDWQWCKSVTVKLLVSPLLARLPSHENTNKLIHIFVAEAYCDDKPEAL